MQPGFLPSHRVRTRREQTGSGAELCNPKALLQRPLSPKGFTVFKTVPPTENDVIKMSLWGTFSTFELKHLVKPSLI